MRVFESLPIKVKASKLESSIVLFGDEIEISVYFYHWSKIWEDVKHGIEYHRSVEEKLKATEQGRRLKEILRRDRSRLASVRISPRLLTTSGRLSLVWGSGDEGTPP